MIIKKSCFCYIFLSFQPGLKLGIACREGGSNLKPMNSEQLREYGHKMVDFIADYYKNIESFPVLSQVQVFSINYEFPFFAVNSHV